LLWVTVHPNWTLSIIQKLEVPKEALRQNDLTGDFCTSGSEREFTLKERCYANEEIQAGADCDAADTAADNGAAVLQRMGGASAILATATSGDAMGPLVSGLAARGKLIVVGVPQDPIQLNAFPLVFGGRSIYGSLTGTPIDSEDTLAFSVLENIRPMIETLPLEQAAGAYARMMQGKARFRMVLVTKDGIAQGVKNAA
jgi:D-arabinose 1-dehydrogenase-like Zn-dependent alcohol dehydrogenase